VFWMPAVRSSQDDVITGGSDVVRCGGDCPNAEAHQQASVTLTINKEVWCFISCFPGYRIHCRGVRR